MECLYLITIKGLIDDDLQNKLENCIVTNVSLIDLDNYSCIDFDDTLYFFCRFEYDILENLTQDISKLNLLINCIDISNEIIKGSLHDDFNNLIMSDKDLANFIKKYIIDNNSIDYILDKILDGGVESLSPFEKLCINQ